jgi:hypothetical protein
MKAITLDSRGEQKDLRDLRFVLEKMEESDEGFADVEMETEDLEILRAGVAELGGRYPESTRELAQARRDKAGSWVML